MFGKDEPDCRGPHGPLGSARLLSTGSCSGATAEVGTVLPGDLRGAAESNGSGALRDAPGRHRRAHRHRLQKPLRGAFFAVRQNRTTLLFLSRINGRLIPVRVFIGHLLQTPRRRSSPTSGREACSASISSRAKTTARLGRKSPPKRAFLRQNTHPVPPLYAASDGCFKASLRPRQGPKRPEKGVRTLKKEEKTVFSRRTRIVRHLQTPPAVGDQDGAQTNGMNFAQACATGLSTVHLRAPSKFSIFV